MNPLMTDFPKIECPYVRKLFEIDAASYKKYKRTYYSTSVKGSVVSLVINQINPGYEWVFNDSETIAVEKLDGFPVKLNMNEGTLIAAQNRLEVLNLLGIAVKGSKNVPASKNFVLEGILEAVKKDYIQLNGQQSGELIGTKVNGNLYKIDGHLWYPFDKAVSHLRYKCWHEHERTFENISSWFKDFIFSIFDKKRISKLDDCLNAPVLAEGIVFYNLQRKEEGKPYMAKLRRDMFHWFYEPKIKIFDYDPNCDSSSIQG